MPDDKDRVITNGRVLDITRQSTKGNKSVVELKAQSRVAQLARHHLVDVLIGAHVVKVIGITGKDSASNDAALVEPTNTLLAQFIQTTTDPSTAILGIHRDIGAVVPGMADVMVRHTVLTGYVSQRMVGVIEVELNEKAQAHADGAAVVEHHKVAFREHLSQPFQLACVVEIGRIDSREHRQF